MSESGWHRRSKPAALRLLSATSLALPAISEHPAPDWSLTVHVATKEVAESGGGGGNRTHVREAVSTLSTTIEINLTPLLPESQ